MVEYKTPGEIDAMHAAGQVVAQILAAVRDQAAPGVRLAELDATARDVLAAAGASSPFLGYQPTPAQSPFPAVICASVNDAALHDIPGRYRLPGRRPAQRRLRRHPGRLVRRRRGLGPGRTRPARGRPPHRGRRPGAAGRDRRRRARRAAGRRLGRGRRGGARRRRTASRPTSAATASATPCTRTRTFPTAAGPAAGCACVPGLVIAIEPWFLSGGLDQCEVDGNGWTVRSTDGSRAAHVEHTVARVTADGPVRASDRARAGRPGRG